MFFFLITDSNIFFFIVTSFLESKLHFFLYCLNFTCRHTTCAEIFSPKSTKSECYEISYKIYIFLLSLIILGLELHGTNKLLSSASFLKCFSISPLSSSSFELFVIQSVYSCIIKVSKLNVDAIAVSSHFTTSNRLGKYSVES